MNFVGSHPAPQVAPGTVILYPLGDSRLQPQRDVAPAVCHRLLGPRSLAVVAHGLWSGGERHRMRPGALGLLISPTYVCCRVGDECRVHCCQSTVRGQRPAQEDRLRVKYTRSALVAGCFDGHYGHRASEWAAARLAKDILGAIGDHCETTRVEKALAESFLRCACPLRSTRCTHPPPLG